VIYTVAVFVSADIETLPARKIGRVT